MTISHEYKQAFEGLVNDYRAIDSALVVEPTEPVEEYTQRALNLGNWARPDIDALVAGGLYPTVLDQVAPAVQGLRYTQAAWDGVRFNSSDAARRMYELTESLRDKASYLFHGLTYALQDDARALRHVRYLRDGASKADLVQDSFGLHSIYNRHKDKAARVGIAESEAEDALAMADELSRLIAVENAQGGASSEAKDMRDRAFTHLKRIVDKIRACGQFVFWRTPSRLSGYTDSYSPRSRGSEEQQTVETGAASQS